MLEPKPERCLGRCKCFFRALHRAPLAPERRSEQSGREDLRGKTPSPCRQLHAAPRPAPRAPRPSPRQRGPGSPPTLEPRGSPASSLATPRGDLTYSCRGALRAVLLAPFFLRSYVTMFLRRSPAQTPPLRSSCGTSGPSGGSPAARALRLVSHALARL